MSGKWITILGLLLVAGIAALLWGPGESTPSSLSDFGANEIQDGLEKSIAVVAADLDDRSESTDRSENLVPETVGNSVDVLPPFDGENGIDILLMDADTMKPVPHGDVYTLDKAEMERRGLQLKTPDGITGMVRMVRANGQHYRAGENGKVRIPRAVESSAILAETKTLLGFEQAVSLKKGTMGIRMLGYPKLTVSVLDSEGRSVSGAAVVVQELWASRLRTLNTLRTNEAGVVTFEGMLADRFWGGKKAVKEVTLGIPTQKGSAIQSPRVELTDAVFAAGKVSLTMPETGKVRIRMLDGQGEVYQESGTIQLMAFEGEDVAATNKVTEIAANGVAEFEFVGLSTKLKAVFKSADSRNEDEVIFEGPLQAGQWTEASIIHSDRPYLTGVLLDPDGKPIAEQTISLRQKDLRENGPLDSRPTTKTDAAGRFRYEPKEISWHGKLLSRNILFTAELEAFGKCNSKLDIPVGLNPGPHDLGEITLLGARMLLSGRVLDEQDAPIEGASVKVQCKVKNEGSGYWPSYANVSGKSNSDGAFLIQGDLPTAEVYHVEIQARGFDPQKQKITLGLTDLDFRLKTSGRLVGSVLLDEGIDASTLGVRLKSDHQDQRISLLPSVEKNRYSILFQGNAESPYSLEVRISSTETIFRLDGVVLTSGQETRPPEFQPLDLRGMLSETKIEIKNVEGEFLAAEILIKNGNRRSQLSTGIGACSFLQSKPIKEMEVKSVGYATKVLKDVAGDQVVILERALEIFVDVPEEFVKYRDSFLTIQVFAEEENGSSQNRIGKFNFTTTGRAKLFVPKTGKYTVEVRVSHRKGNFTRSSKLNRTVHEVHESGKVIELVIDQEKLDEEIDSLIDSM